jgi:hypothetical protein
MLTLRKCENFDQIEVLNSLVRGEIQLKINILVLRKKTIDQKPIAHVAQLNKMIINLLAPTPTAPNLTRAVFLITLLEGDAFM